MNRFFTKTFGKFFLGFLCMLGLAFAVMLAAANYRPTGPVDNVALPR